MLSAGFSFQDNSIPGNVHRNVQDGCCDSVQPARYDGLHCVPPETDASGEGSLREALSSHEEQPLLAVGW